LPNHPRQIDGLEINAVEDGFMIYRAEQDRLHYLNHSAVVVLEFCDGKRSAAEIADLVRRAYGLSKTPRKDIDETLKNLAREGLVTTGPRRRRLPRSQPVRREGKRRARARRR
jgi:hypothetical protein